MHKVTVVGTYTPCAGVDLAPGEVRENVAVTDHLRSLVRNGCVKLAKGHSFDPPRATGGAVLGPVASPDSIPVMLAQGYVVPSSQVDDLASIPDVEASDQDVEPAKVERPARNASRAAWAEYLDNHDPDPIDYPRDGDRGDLIAAYDAWEAAQEQPEDGVS